MKAWSRRRFLAAGAFALSGPALAEALAARTGLGVTDWRIVDAVQAHLLPSEPDAPGAREANALLWLAFVLEDPKVPAELKTLLRAGPARLARHSRTHGGTEFLHLDEAGRERILRSFEEDPEGRRWLQEILGFTLEALLGDPVYGVNPGGRAWKWLGWRPGFRRPDAETRYFLL